ncbi:MAG: hypothetical protein MK098_03915 [Marinovum sp.]|nr:hypothetical protein [Marinovum sp.]
MNVPLAITMSVITLGFSVNAATGAVEVSTVGLDRCILSGGLPNHPTGTFPNTGNPHSMRSQNTRVCIPMEPQKGLTARDVQTSGIAKNGVLIRPGTAD